MLTYGIDFPFKISPKGSFLTMTETPEREIRANLVHLILTRKGTRYYLPDFGTRLYEFIFEQNDSVTWGQIEDEIRVAIKNYIPNLEIKSITVNSIQQDNGDTMSNSEIDRLFNASYDGSRPYTAKVRIDYDINNQPFVSSDFVIINI